MPPAAPALQPPPLPAGAPRDLFEFVQGDRERVEFRAGRASWLPSPPVLGSSLGRFLRPTVTIEPGTSPGEAEVAVGWSRVRMRLRARTVDGTLRVEPVPPRIALLASVYTGVDSWVGQLNRWLSAKGWRLRPAEVTSGRLLLVKERVAVPPDLTSASGDEDGGAR